MSPQHARIRTLYELIALNFVMLVALVALALYMAHLRNEIQAVQQQTYAACMRGNVVREALRFALISLGSPERARLPEIKHQPCNTLYRR